MEAAVRLVFCLFLPFLLASDSDKSQSRRTVPDGEIKVLYRHLFQDYQPQVRPVVNDSRVVTISVQFWFKQILKVDEGDQILTIYCWLEEYWSDEYLVWDPEEFQNITVIHVPAEKIWKPDLLVYNNANMNIKENELETNAIIGHDGQVQLFRSVITDITCSLDLSYFPFDQQVCHLMLASWSFDGSKVLLEPYGDKEDYNSNLDFYIANAEWTMMDFKFKRNLKFYDCCPYPYPDISYYFIIRRNPAYYILSLIIPSGFITIVTIIGFFTPHSSSGENTEKVSLGVTALLSMAIIMMMVADEMPATSKVMPLIGKYYIGLIFIIFAAAFTTTITLSIQMRGNAGKPVSPLARKIFLDILPKYCLFTTVILPEEFTEEIGGPDDIQPDEKVYIFNKKERVRIGYSNGTHASRHMPEPPEILKSSKRQKSKQKILKRTSFRQKPLDTTSSFKMLLRQSGIQSPSSIVGHPELNDNDKGLVALEAGIEHLIDGVKSIDGELKERARVELIIKEWQQMTRVIERILMLFFIFSTGFFAFVMLHFQGDEMDLKVEMKRFLS